MNRSNGLVLAVLYLVVIGLSLLVVANRHESRRLFADVKKLEEERDRLSDEWSRLKLQQSTLLNQVHVETQARDSLGMRKPSAENIRVIRE